MTEGTVDKLRLGQRRIIERPRLTRMLDDSPARIKMLVAPAGYGKTTLARQWLAHRSGHAWLGLTSAANDPAELMSQLAALAGAVQPGADARVRERLRYTSQLEHEWPALVDMLIDNLVVSDDPKWIGIDDYHVLVGSQSNSEALLNLFIERIPFGVLLIGRERPAWITTRMILYGDVTEIGRAALAMTVDEATAAFDHGALSLRA